MKPIAAFDLESADIFLNPGEMIYPSIFETDVRIWGTEENDFTIKNPGISIAAVATDEHTSYFESDLGKQRIERGGQMIADLVDYLYTLAHTHTIVTWNGLKFDCQVLAQEAGGDIALLEKITYIAESHCDLMYIIFCKKGYFVGLDQALQPLELSKIHTVFLRDGTQLNDMYGGRAPQLWAEGERDAVRTYLKGDVQSLLELAKKSEQDGYIRWRSNKGKLMAVKSYLDPVSVARELPLPNTSWMTDPPDRADFSNWLNKEKEYVSPNLL